MSNITVSLLKIYIDTLKFAFYEKHFKRNAIKGCQDD